MAKIRKGCDRWVMMIRIDIPIPMPHLMAAITQAR